MQFFNSEFQQLYNKKLIDDKINKDLSQVEYILGLEVDELEQKLVTYTGAKYCRSFGNNDNRFKTKACNGRV